MTDLEKTIDDLKLLNALCHGTVLDDAIELLKRQQRIEPVTDKLRNRRCPKCDTVLKGRFCYECGQAVKWDA